MLRRYAVIALVALVLIPAAVLAVGFHGRFGHRDVPGAANATQWTPNGTAGATHPNWTTGAGPWNRTFHGDGACANLSSGRDRGLPGDFGTMTNRTCDQDRSRAGNRTAANQTGARESGRKAGLQGFAHRGQGG